MGKILKSGVTIKGTRNGLLFLLDDVRPFTVILNELRYKLEQSANIWDGPDTAVSIRLGQRQITRQEETELRQLFAIRRNLIIREIEAEGMPYLLDENRGIQVKTGTIRSGQMLEQRGDLLLLGDVNPGGSVRSTGSIYILGALRGLAHAGIEGDDSCIIVASIFRPTQLRIAETISRAPDEWEESEIGSKFAYLLDGQIAVDKMNHLGQLWPDKLWKESRLRQ